MWARCRTDWDWNKDTQQQNWHLFVVCLSTEWLFIYSFPLSVLVTTIPRVKEGNWGSYSTQAWLFYHYPYDHHNHHHYLNYCRHHQRFRCGCWPLLSKPIFVWFRASTEKYPRTALFWDITQRVVVDSYRRFGTTYRSHPQGPRINSKAVFVHAWTGPEGSRRLRLPDFKTFGTWRW